MARGKRSADAVAAASNVAEVLILIREVLTR